MMNRLEPEIIALKDSIKEIQACLIVSHERGKEAEKNQEALEHRVSVLEDICVLAVEGIEQRVKFVEQNVEILDKNMTAAITRINDLHKCLKSLANNDLRCKEELDNSDEEFDLSDYDDKIDEEITRVKQMSDETVE